MSSVAVTRDGIRRLMRSPTAWQAAAYTGANLATNALAVVSTAMITRNLTTTEYSTYSFALSLVMFVALFFEFGLFLPAARLAAVARGSESREIVGSALLLYLPVGLAFSAFVFGLSFWIEGWFHIEAGHALRVVAPLGLAFPFTFVLLQLSQGLDRLHVSSFTGVLAQ